MKYKDVLNEYSPEVPLKKWNMEQFRLWKELGKYKKPRDLDTFKKFATIFDTYYKAHHSFPKAKEIAKEL